MSEIKAEKNYCGGELRLVGHSIIIENILGQLFETKEGLDLIHFAYPTLNDNEIEFTKDYVYNLLKEKSIQERID